MKLLGVYHTPAPDTDRYAIRVSNFGAAEAQGVLARLSVDGTVAASGTFGSLAAKSSVKLVLRGPECQDFVAGAGGSGQPDRRVRGDGQRPAQGLLRAPIALIDAPASDSAGEPPIR